MIMETRREYTIAVCCGDDIVYIDACGVSPADAASRAGRALGTPLELDGVGRDIHGGRIARRNRRGFYCGPDCPPDCPGPGGGGDDDGGDDDDRGGAAVVPALVNAA